jgi:hypothetical protein
VLHSNELWALPGYEGLPRVTPEFPIVSMDDDDAVCLTVRTPAADRRIWMTKVDTQELRSKTLLSLVRYNNKHMNDESDDLFDNIGLIPSDISKYLPTGLTPFPLIAQRKYIQVSKLGVFKKYYAYR